MGKAAHPTDYTEEVSPTGSAEGTGSNPHHHLQPFTKMSPYYLNSAQNDHM